DPARLRPSPISGFDSELRIDLVDVPLAVVAVVLRSSLVEDRREHVDALRVVSAGQLQFVAPRLGRRAANETARFVGPHPVPVAKLRAFAPARLVAPSLRLANRGGAAVNIPAAIDVDATEPHVRVGRLRIQAGGALELVDGAVV